MQSCYFAKLNIVTVLLFSLPSPSSMLKLPISAPLRSTRWSEKPPRDINIGTFNVHELFSLFSVFVSTIYRCNPKLKLFFVRNLVLQYINNILIKKSVTYDTMIFSGPSLEDFIIYYKILSHIIYRNRLCRVRKISSNKQINRFG